MAKKKDRVCPLCQTVNDAHHSAWCCDVRAAQGWVDSYEYGVLRAALKRIVSLCKPWEMKVVLGANAEDAMKQAIAALKGRGWKP